MLKASQESTVAGKANKLIAMMGGSRADGLGGEKDQKKATSYALKAIAGR